MSDPFVINRIVDALREVAVALQTAVDEGHRSRAIDADDLAETLLSIADRLDPPVEP
jgi:pyrimidine operon attenuation protein/uracil phosphoribosyltransferase